jgi:zinc D-Ala-D-Ala carboxypeptidase
MEGFSPRWPLSALTHSDTATRRGINNEPPAELLPNLARLSRALFAIEEALLKKYPRSRLTITSGYRSAKLNAVLGGSKTSAHMQGLAADLQAQGLSALELANLIKSVVTDFDQIIHEYGRWTHLGVKGDKAPRRQLLTAKKNSLGKTYYENGLNPV